jgi:hypothetical protein
LSAFRFLFSFVIAVPGLDPGIDPAIHAAKRLFRVSDRLSSLHFSMDHRVKPGGDDESGMALAKRA